MSLVVSDTGPVHYLILCEAVEVIPKLYDRLVIPSAVALELTHLGTPPAVRRWVEALPGWATIQTPTHTDPVPQLGLGEREAIALALELRAAQLLMDERVGRRVAVQRGLSIAGTVGVLEQAAKGGWLNLSDTLQKLLAGNFRISPDVVRDALDRDANRRRTSKSGT